MRSHKILYVALSILALYVWRPFPLRAGVPTEQVQATVDKVLTVLQDARLKAADKEAERRSQLRQILEPRFDFKEMAKRSLGAYWQHTAPEKQQEFVKLFTDFLERTYADKIDSYNGEKVLYVRENADQDYAEVDTKVVTKKGDEVAINYKLHSGEGQWKVYDVVIENVSLVNNYRSQFNRVIAESSFDELLRRMRDKQFDAPGKKKKGESA